MPVSHDQTFIRSPFGSPIHRYIVLVDCTGKELLKHTYIGVNKDVSAEYYSCASNFGIGGSLPSLERRQNNQCGAPCTTNCFNPAGGGPDPNDCQIIADALLFESQNTGTAKL
jgi:hypothetical protein